MKEIDDFKRDSRGVRKMGAYAKKYSKFDDEPGEAADLSALLAVSIEQIGSRVRGRPPIYENTEEGLREFLGATKNYFEYIRDANAVNDEKLIPDIEGWSTFLGITRQTVLAYSQRNESWEEAISYVKDAILAAKKQLAFRFKIPPVIFLNDASNNHGYLNTSEFRISTNNEMKEQLPTQTREQIAAKYAGYIGAQEPERPDLN